MQAIPSAEEAGAVRRVIDRCRAVLDELPEAERAAVDEAIAVLRRGRAQLDVTVPVRFLGLVTQPAPTLFPTSREPGRSR